MNQLKKTALLMMALVVFVVCLLSGCTPKSNSVQEVPTVDIYKAGDGDENYVELKRINRQTWYFTTYATLNQTRYPANGVLVETADGLVLIDTPWNNEQTKNLLGIIQKQLKQSIKLAIITHAHDDRLGGLDTLIANKIEAVSSPLTAELAEKRGYGKLNPTLKNHQIIQMGNAQFEILIPGHGHSADNIAVYLVDQKIMFGGCLVKSLDAKGLGNLGEAHLKTWTKAIEKMKERDPEVKVVIPGHGNPGDAKLYAHTLDLLENGFMSLEIGKMLYIEFRPENIRNENFTDDTDKIDMLFKKTDVEKLRRYLKKKKLEIKPGIYEINQTATFEQMVEILKFEKVRR